jgi:hypothetical protein
MVVVSHQDGKASVVLVSPKSFHPRILQHKRLTKPISAVAVTHDSK